MDDERRETFGAALEQPEQLFAAGGAVGYETRPLLLFYAVSQAGRAIMAMSSRADWKTSGHGTGATQLDGFVREVEMRNQNKGLFISVADEIGSSSLVEAARLADLLASIPEVSPTVPRIAAGSPALLLRRQRYRGQEFWGGPEVESTGISFSDGWVFGLRTGFVGLPPDTEYQAVAELLRNYPTMEGWSIPGETIQVGFNGSDIGFRLAWDAAGMTGPDRQQRIRQIWGVEVDDVDGWVLPSLGANEIPMRPLATWWAALHALSMLARYEPAAWARALDIDASDAAASIETALDVGMVRMPELIRDELVRYGVAGGP